MAIKQAQVDIVHRHNWSKDIPLSTPFVIYIEPSGYCNLRCKFCPYAIHSSTTQKDLLTLASVDKIIVQLKEFPSKLKLLRYCGNGEPLINKDIIDICKFFHLANIAQKTQMITNGTLFTTNLINILPQYLDMIVISLQGMCENDYLKISGRSIDYKNFLNNLKELYSVASANQCCIHIKTTNLSASTKQLKQQFFEQFSGLCDEIFIENVIPQYPQMDYYYEDKLRFSDEKPNKRRVICPQIFKSLQIQANGDVIPCCVDWRRKNYLGNIHNISLKEMWCGSLLTTLRNTHLAGKRFNIEPCKDCWMNEYTEIDNIDNLLA